MSRLSHPQGSVRPCRASQLRLELGPLVSEQSEQDSIGLEFLDVSTATCSLNGYPKVELIGKNAVVLPFTYSHLGDAEVTSKLPSIVSLRARAAAYVMINQRACVLPHDPASTVGQTHCSGRFGRNGRFVVASTVHRRVSAQ